MAYLLDTNVVSELRRERPHGGVLAWLNGVGEHQIAISSVTCGEIQRGIEITRGQNPQKADEIERWLSEILAIHYFIAMDEACFRKWAQLMHSRPKEKILDGMIAATALVHRLTVATRDVQDFKALGVATINPWEAQQT
ncbi:MAG: type II toxin-antitoxin system VapC family toxin [Alphaproteobacteria bacterium]|nr:type II toxin-antitoxin system VapC family toxin [Alphaproteobacteria bacterium]